jgi:hypothetical protein
MKYNINNQMILLATLSTFTFSGCVAKNEVKSMPISYNQFSEKVNQSWKKRGDSWKKASKPWQNVSKNSNKKDDDCVDCYATDIDAKKRTLKQIKVNRIANNEIITYDYSKAPSEQTINKNYYEYQGSQGSESVYDKTAINTLHYGAYDYTVASSVIKPKTKRLKVAQQPKNVYSSKGSYVSGTTIQVGAFRHYSGAKKIAKKYDLLSSKYNVKIETGIKENTPIHRVRIEGFTNTKEAKKFILRYAISDAFLVRR